MMCFLACVQGGGGLYTGYVFFENLPIYLLEF